MGKLKSQAELFPFNVVITSFSNALLVFYELPQITFRWFTALEAMIVYDIDTLLLEQFAHSSIRIEQIFLMYKARLIIFILGRHILIVFTNLCWFHADNLLAQSLVKFNIIVILSCPECDNGTVFPNLCDILCGTDIGGRRMGISSEP